MSTEYFNLDEAQVVVAEAVEGEDDQDEGPIVRRQVLHDYNFFNRVNAPAVMKCVCGIRDIVHRM